MKSDIHPKYFTNAKATCACGAVYEIGSTKEEISNEICSHCHPFYTGKENILDAAGRVDRFKKRQVASTEKKTKSKK